MYEEWMNGFPIIMEGCDESNAWQKKKAENYYKENNVMIKNK